MSRSYTPAQLAEWAERTQALRHDSVDHSAPASGSAKSERIDLGLALLSYHAEPGVCYSHQEIAVWAGCTNTAIRSIEERALKKLRARGDGELEEIIAGMRSERSAAWKRRVCAP